MPCIRTDTDQMDNLKESLNKIKRDLSELENNIMLVNRSLDWKVSVRQTVGDRLCAADNRLCRSLNQLDFLIQMIDRVKNDFISTDKRLKTMGEELITKISKISTLQTVLIRMKAFQKLNGYNYFHTFIKNRNGAGDAFFISVSKGENALSNELFVGGNEIVEIKKSLTSVLSHLTMTENEFDQVPEEVEIVVRALKVGGSVSDKLKKKYGPVIDALDHLGTGIDCLNLSVETLEYILTDYSKNLSYIEVLKENLEGADESFIKAIHELETDYTNKYIGSLRRMGAGLSEIAFEHVIEEGAKGILTKTVSVSAGLAYEVADFAKDTFLKLSGLEEKADNLNGLYVINAYKHEIHASASLYSGKIATGNYTKDDMEHYKMMFDLYKAATIEEYELMIALSGNKEEKELLSAELEKLKEESFSR